jgi:phosphoglycerol transferase MdoB-like AlkP superfamily enzyme
MLPGVEFSENPLANYDEIVARENTVSGRFFTTGFGGGTVRPEFEVLTGLTTDRLPAGSVPWQYITSKTESYVSAYKNLGYKTVAMHPYTSSFYLRKEAYPLIAFDELRFEDTFYHHPDIPVKIDGNQITDETFAEHIIYYLENSHDPVFLFGISMENHQPYTDKYSTHTVTVKSDTIDAGVLADVENYTQGVLHADKALKMLVDYIDSRERDTVLVWFGDHLPTLGANYAAYAQSGMIDLSGMTTDMKEMLQSTPYIIYSNFEFKENSMLSAGKGNDIASYNLLNALSGMIGAPRTPLMSFLEDFYRVFPYYNVRLFTEYFPDEIWSFVNSHAALTYDRTVGNKYSLK